METRAGLLVHQSWRPVVRAPLVAALLVTAAFGCSSKRAAESALVSFISAAKSGHDSQACQAVWRHDLGPSQCEKLTRFVRDHSPDLPPTGKIESTLLYGHGAGAEIALVSGSKRFAASLICSTELREHRTGRGCTWYVSSLSER